MNAMSTLQKVYSIFFALLLSITSAAQTTDTNTSNSTSHTAADGSSQSAADAGADAPSAKVESAPVLEPVTEANPQFKNWGVTGNFSLFEMWVLTKYGITGYYTQDPKRDYELEYMRGSLGFGYFGINIGSIKEERISLLTRSFGKRNSLNFLYGVFYNKMNIGLSQKLLNSVNPELRSNVNNVELSMAGLTWGFGNRWQTREGYIFGIDWLVLNIPFSTIQQRIPFFKQSQSQDSRDNVKDALNWLKKIPSVGVLKFQIGMTF